jgi:hypothetical protein
MKYFISSITLLTLMGILSGCGGGGGGSDTTTPNNTLSNISNIDANGIADDLNDSIQLSNDIGALFGTANAEPIAIGDNETLSNVINRVQNTSN